MSTQVVKQNEFVENSSLEWQNVGDKIKRKIMAYDGSLMLVKCNLRQEVWARFTIIIIHRSHMWKVENLKWK